MSDDDWEDMLDDDFEIEKEGDAPKFEEEKVVSTLD